MQAIRLLLLEMVQREYAKCHSKAAKLILVAEFLRGNTKSNDCEALFKNYKTCLDVRVLQA